MIQLIITGNNIHDTTTNNDDSHNNMTILTIILIATTTTTTTTTTNDISNHKTTDDNHNTSWAGGSRRLGLIRGGGASSGTPRPRTLYGDAVFCDDICLLRELHIILCICILWIYIYFSDPGRAARAGLALVGKGQMGSALMGSLQIFLFFDRGTFLGTPVNLLLSPQKCQGVPFSPICQSSLLLQRPH